MARLPLSNKTEVIILENPTLLEIKKGNTSIFLTPENTATLFFYSPDVCRSIGNCHTDSSVLMQQYLGANMYVKVESETHTVDISHWMKNTLPTADRGISLTFEEWQEFINVAIKIYYFNDDMRNAEPTVCLTTHLSQVDRISCCLCPPL